MKYLGPAWFCLLPVHGAFASTTMLDVVSPHGNTKDHFVSFGQTFTPQSTGTLDRLRLMIASSAPSFTVTIWEFDPVTNQLGRGLGSQSLVSSMMNLNYSWAEVSFAEPILQTAGVPLAFTVVGNESFWGPAMSTNSIYAGGAFFEYSGISLTLLDRDVAFETYVTPVPEPGSCVMAWLFSLYSLCRRKRS